MALPKALKSLLSGLVGGTLLGSGGGVAYLLHVSQVAGDIFKQKIQDLLIQHPECHEVFHVGGIGGSWEIVCADNPELGTKLIQEAWKYAYEQTQVITAQRMWPAFVVPAAVVGFAIVAGIYACVTKSESSPNCFSRAYSYVGSFFSCCVKKPEEIIITANNLSPQYGTL